MADLVENKIWESGIYQIEETDDVLGGANGVSNTQGKQLANRTFWLKDKTEQIDVVNSALDNRLDSVEAEVSEARDGQVNLGTRLENDKPKSGIIMIYNRYVIRGFDPSYPVEGQSGRDIYFMDLDDGYGNYALINGQKYNFPDTFITIPHNESEIETITWYFYARINNGSPVIEMAQSVPVGSLVLGKYVSPPNDYAWLSDFYSGGGVWIDRYTDLRIFTEIEGWYASYYGNAYVSLSSGLVSTINYAIHTEVISANSLPHVGELRVTGKSINGFNVSITGSADNVQVRWTLIPFST